MILSFTRSSPLRHQLPENSLFWHHPTEFLRRWWHCIQLHNADRQDHVRARHDLKSEDAIKQQEYLDAHNMPREGPVAYFWGQEAARISRRGDKAPTRTDREGLVVPRSREVALTPKV